MRAIRYWAILYMEKNARSEANPACYCTPTKLASRHQGEDLVLTVEPPANFKFHHSQSKFFSPIR